MLLIPALIILINLKPSAIKYDLILVSFVILKNSFVLYINEDISQKKKDITFSIIIENLTITKVTTENIVCFSI